MINILLITTYSCLTYQLVPNCYEVIAKYLLWLEKISVDNFSFILLVVDYGLGVL